MPTLDLPKHLMGYLTDMYLKDMKPAWVRLDASGEHIAEMGGDWSVYCDGTPSIGNPADDLNPVLMGLFPMPDDFRLSQIEGDNERYFDIDIIQHDGCWVMFSDVTSITLRLQKMQQATNSLHLKYSRSQQILERHVGQPVVDKVHAGSYTLKAEGIRQYITTMFIDVRNFTVFNEAHDAQVVMTTINAYLDIILDEVLNHQGIIDKVTGDGAMTVFGVTGEHKHGAEQSAYDAALIMMNRVASHNQERESQGLEAMKIGMGIASGEAVTGVVGTHKRRAFTAFGRHVNLAARLESKAPGGSILLDDPTYQALSDRKGQTFSTVQLTLKGIGDMQAWRNDVTLS
ncbi:MAG: adenylate/guanylate cyclase domain-containing protein [Mariprofundaceae bacterium]|nr:adenylate/guanylate cyclase domain-containing protein [Mariprofundaceae bacterium]